jgi:hypothetical protein
MAEYSRIAKGHFTSTGAAKTILLPFVPDQVEIFNYTSNGTPAQYGVPRAYWDSSMGQGYAVAQVFNATPVLTTQNFTVGGISTFTAGQSFQYGARQQIIGATKASPIVFNVTGHGYTVGDIVMFEGLYQSSTTGMPQICGMPFCISAIGDSDHFTVVWNGNQSNYTALSTSPTGAYVKKVLNPFLFAPGVSFISALTLSSTTTVVTTTPHNLSVGSQVAFRIPSAYGTVELNSLPNNAIPGSPIYGYVTSVTDAETVVVNINSTGYTAFTNNVAVSSVPGMQFPQMVAVGDNNSGSGLYGWTAPSVNGVSTIGGPAIAGAFLTNSNMGFVIGSTAVSTAVLVGANSDVIYWRALLSDLSTS